jgi:two-component system nitrogen regulation sensor histidine kinase NtrY
MASEKLLSSRSRIILLSLATTSFVAAGMVYQEDHIPVSVVLLISGIVLLLLVNAGYNSTNEAISFLFDALRNDDTSVRFQETVRNRTLSKVYKNINTLNEHYQNIKNRSEYNESFYRTVIEHASAGLLILGNGNRIELINRTACIYAGISPSSTNPNQLKIKHPAFYEAVCNIKQGETVTYKNLVSGNLQLLLFRATIIRRKDEELKLVAIQDIRSELESREIESYRKLISVLTHEIMNQLSPLTSVARELHSMLTRNEHNNELLPVEDSALRTTINGLKLINEQSDGLVSFMNNYRKISKIPQPEFFAFPVEEWSEQLRIAFLSKMKDHNIEFTISHDISLREIIADRKLLNQVMVNLINNAFDAVVENSGERRIEIRMEKNQQGRIIIKVTNNGTLIPADLIEKIFVPFFTTKKNGSGVGLSICQEIMKMHNGSIVAVSSEESETSFIVEF